MAFPTDLDDFETIDCSTTTDPKTAYNNHSAAIEAIEAKVGVDNSAVTTSLDYLVKNASSSNPGHKHTLVDGAMDVTATAAELNTLDGITASTAELNVLDGVTATTSELNILDGVTATASEINILDGATITVDYLNSLLTGWVPAGETWTYSSVDDPTGVITVAGDVTSKYSKGMKIRFVNAGNTIYGKVSATPTYSAPNTTITFLHEIDPSDNLALNLLQNSAITSPHFSYVDRPYGFPVNGDSWAITVITAPDKQSSPVQNTWYNLGGNITIPIGSWEVYYETTAYADDTSSTYSLDCLCTLSTANNSESDSTMSTTGAKLLGTAATSSIAATARKTRFRNLTSKTQYFLNARTTITGVNQLILGFGGTSVIRVVSTL